MCDAMLEAARAGGNYAEVEAAGRGAVDPDEVLDGVRELLDEVRLEVLLGDGARVIALVDPLGRGDAPDPLGPGALLIGDPSDVVLNEGPGDDRARGHQPVAAPDPDLVALPVRAGQRPAGLRPRRRPRLPPRPAPPARTRAGSRARRRRCAWCGTRARAARDDDPPLRGGVPDALRRHDRRPDPPRRHEPLDPGRRRTGLRGATSRSGATRRTCAAGSRSGMVRAAHPSSTSSWPARSSSTLSSAWSRPTSASRTAASPASVAPGAPRSATASTSSSAPTRSRSWPTGSSSPRAPSTPTSTRSARSCCHPRSRPASRR